jgi:hypothetical protein
MQSLKVVLLVSLITLFPQLAFAQTCRWDGTAPWCAGACGRGETEVFRASDLPPHWKDAFPVVQNTNFGEACVVCHGVISTGVPTPDLACCTSRRLRRLQIPTSSTTLPRSHMFFIKDDNNTIVLVSPIDRRIRLRAQPPCQPWARC